MIMLLIWLSSFNMQHNASVTVQPVPRVLIVVPEPARSFNDVLADVLGGR